MEDVARAIEALHNVHNPDQLRDASQWLNAFSETNEAWEISITLLVPERPAPVQFFAANMLLAKVRRDWGRLSPDNRTAVSTAISAALHQLLGQDNAQLMVLQRLAMAVGSCAARSEAAQLHGFLSDILALPAQAPAQQDKGWDTAVLEVLSTAAEEAEQLPGPRRKAALSVMTPLAPTAFSLVAAKAGSQCGALAFRCMAAWLKLHVHGAGGTLVSPAEFAQSQGPLLEASLAGLASSDMATAEAAADALVVLLGRGRQLEGEKGAEADKQAMVRAILGLLEQGQRGVEAREEAPAHLFRGLARVAVAIAERSPEMVATTHLQGRQVELAQLVLGCLSSAAHGGDRGTAESAVEYFDMLSTVAVEERPPELRKPLYISLLQGITVAARYPPDFWGWDHSAEDEEEFTNFRDYVLKDALEICYSMLELAYLIALGQQMVEATTVNDWQGAEVVLFAIRGVAYEVVQSAQIRSCRPSADAQQTVVLLVALFTQVVGEGSTATMFGRVPWLVDAVCQLISAYDGWFPGPLVSVLDPVMRYLLTALTLPQAQQSAADAFQRVCTTCPHHLNDPAVLTWLLTTVAQLLQKPGVLKMGQKEAVVQGLARIVAVLPPEEATTFSLQLVTPLLRPCEAAVQQGDGTVGGRSETVAEGLMLVADALRFMEFSGVSPAEHPVHAILQASWPLLTHLAESAAWRADEPTMSAMCLVFQRALMGVKSGGEMFLAPLLQAIVAGFEACGAPGCLDTLATAAEFLGNSEACHQLLCNALASATATGLKFLEDEQHAHAAMDEAALFSMADRCLLSTPSALLASGALGPLFVGALLVSRRREAEPLRAALRFMAHIANESYCQRIIPHNGQSVGEQRLACLKQHAEAMMHTLIYAASDTCPIQLLRQLGEPLYALLQDTAFGQAAGQWLVQSVMSPGFPGRTHRRVSEEDCHRFCTLATTLPGLSALRFASLVNDFGSICQGESTSDSLLAYEM